MAGWIDYRSTGDSLQWVNEMLAMAGLPPVVDLRAASSDSDAGLAWKRLNTTIRAVAAKGWWFNTRLRQVLTTDEFGYFSIAFGVSAKESSQMTGEDSQPQMRLGIMEGSTVAAVWNIDDDTDVFPANTEYTLDVIYMAKLDNIPTLFADYCLLKAGRQFAAGFGIKVDPYDEERAWDALDKAESQFAVTPNRNDNPEIYRDRIR